MKKLNLFILKTVKFAFRNLEIVKNSDLTTPYVIVTY